MTPLNSEQFETLLRQLSPDRDLAGVRYEQLRRRLVTVFTYRGCAQPEELADETMDRVARRLMETRLAAEITDPAGFVFRVAWNVAKEWLKRQRTVALPDDWDSADQGQSEVTTPGSGIRHDCLDRCLRCLSAEDRDVVLAYYQEKGVAKIRERSNIARHLKISAYSFRVTTP